MNIVEIKELKSENESFVLCGILNYPNSNKLNSDGIMLFIDRANYVMRAVFYKNYIKESVKHFKINELDSIQENTQIDALMPDIINFFNNNFS